MSEISISNVINVSVSQPGIGVGRYNTSNIALFSHEPHENFGGDKFKIYKEPLEVAKDFGSSSLTYKQAVSIFSQQPNILANRGYLVIVPLLQDLPSVTAVQKITFSEIPDAGSFKLKYGDLETAAIADDDVAADVQTKLRALEGLGDVTVSGDFEVGFTVTFVGVAGPVANLVVTENSLDDEGGFNVEVFVETITPGQNPGEETLAAAIARATPLVQFFGILSTQIQSEENTLAAGTLVQSLLKIIFFPSSDPASVDPEGRLDKIRLASLTQSRGLLYEDGKDSEALIESAAYASRLLSTVFTGSNTTSTMNLKTLRGVLPDLSLTQTLIEKAKLAGADVYPSIQGVPAVLSFGANEFVDNVYNLLAFVGDIQISEFNVLKQTATKIPQTEGGMDQLKGAARRVCDQYVRNGFVSPGEWNSPNTFGNQEEFFLNIQQFGYYIYSEPIALQLPAEREERIAPLIQIAIKLAGAVHSANIIINVNK